MGTLSKGVLAKERWLAKKMTPGVLSEVSKCLCRFLSCLQSQGTDGQILNNFWEEVLMLKSAGTFPSALLSFLKQSLHGFNPSVASIFFIFIFNLYTFRSDMNTWKHA